MSLRWWWSIWVWWPYYLVIEERNAKTPTTKTTKSTGFLLSEPPLRPPKKQINSINNPSPPNSTNWAPTKLQRSCRNTSQPSNNPKKSCPTIHQKFQVPKMPVLHLSWDCFVDGDSLSLQERWGFLHFRWKFHGPPASKLCRQKLLHTQRAAVKGGGSALVVATSVRWRGEDDGFPYRALSQSL